MRGKTSLIWISLLALPLAALARETRSSKSASKATSSEESSFSQETTSGLVVGGQSYDLSESLRMPNTKQMKVVLCQRVREASPLCSNWDQTARSYEEASKVMGIPASYLMCITNKETTFGRAVHTAGLNQFEPATAKLVAEEINTTYRSEFVKYAQATGCNQPVSAAAIRSSDYPQSYCLSNFALAVYMRMNMKGIENEVSLGSASNPSSDGAKKVLKYLIASYNAGPSVGLKYKKKGEGVLPAITKDYIEKVFNKCLKPASAAPGA